MTVREFENLFLEDKEYVLNLPYHLAQAAMAENLCEILTEFEFLQHKVKHKSVLPLIEDYEYEQSNKELKLIQRTLEMSSDVIDKDKNQLAGQLLGQPHTFMNK